MMVDTPGDASSRFEKSLGLLTTKFVTLLQEADGGILDLKVVRIIFEKITNGQFLKKKRSKAYDAFIESPATHWGSSLLHHDEL